MRLVAAVMVLMLPLLAQKSEVESAWALVAQGKRTEAAKLLRGLIQAQPRNADARLLLGSLLMEDGQGPESIAQLREAVRLRPNSADAQNALGEAYHTFGDDRSARPCFERAIALDPRHAQAHVNLAAIMLQQGEFAPALPHLDQAIRLFGGSADAAYAHYLRAKILTEQQETARAAAELKTAVALRPDFPEAWSDLGEARKLLSDNEGALAAYHRAVELSPEDAIARTRLGAMLLESGEAHEAVPHLEAAARLDPKNQSTLNALQRALRKDGQTQKADEVRKRLGEVLRERDAADQALVSAIELNNRGAELEKSGDLRGAAEKYRAAAALEPGHAGIRTNLAVALLKLGRWQEGITEMREAVRLDPGNAELKKALDDALAQARAHGIEVPR